MHTILKMVRPGVWTPVETEPPFRGVLVNGFIPEWDDRIDPDHMILRPLEGW